MQNLSQTNKWNLNLRPILAVAFLVLLLVEWGSHGLAFAHSTSSKAETVYSEENGHEDPCETMISCSDGRRQDQRVPNAGHEKSQHNDFAGRLPDLFAPDRWLNRPRLPREKLHDLSRPISPPFHPPELS